MIDPLPDEEQKHVVNPLGTMYPCCCQAFTNLKNEWNNYPQQASIPLRFIDLSRLVPVIEFMVDYLAREERNGAKSYQT